MTYQITQQLISGLPKNPYRNGSYEGVVAHSTATPNATASAEQNYESNNWGDAFVHFFVDWTSIIQTADTNYICWGAGHTANQRYVQVELCETSDANLFKESYARYTWLLAKLLFDRKLGVNHNVTFFTHADTSALFKETDHTDPVGYLASHGVTVDQLIKDVTDQYNLLSASATVQSVPNVTPVNVKPIMIVKAIGIGDIRALPDHKSGFIRNTKDGELFNVWEQKGDWKKVGLNNNDFGWIDANGGKNLFWVNNPALKPQPAPQPVYYVIKSGDSLSKIAYANGITMTQLKSWNAITNENLIYIGQTIRIK